MKTQTNLRISIPKPCHEDWNKFTPDEKGGFCKVCSKSVHDFTKKTTEEISTILIDEMSAGKKVCGRFNEDQLTTATPTLKGAMQEYNSPLQGGGQPNLYSLNFTRIKKFAFALFLVFGGYIFNHSKAYAQKMGKVAYIPRPEPVKGEVSPHFEGAIEASDPDTNFVVQPLKVTKCNVNMLQGDVFVEPSEQLMGELVAEPFIDEEPIAGQVAIMGDAVITKQQQSVEEMEHIVMGMIKMPEEELFSLDPKPADSALLEIDGEFAVEESTFVETTEPLEEKTIQPETVSIKLECYPNPSTGLINIKYNVPVNGMSSLILYNMNGDLVRTLVPPQNVYAADYSTQFDISELPDGIYFCTLQSGGRKSTQKIILGR